MKNKVSLTKKNSNGDSLHTIGLNAMVQLDMEGNMLVVLVF